MYREEFEETFINSEALENMTKDAAFRLLGRDVAMMIGYGQENPHHCYDLWEHSIKTMQGLACDNDNLLKIAAFFMILENHLWQEQKMAELFTMDMHKNQLR